MVVARTFYTFGNELLRLEFTKYQIELAVQLAIAVVGGYASVDGIGFNTPTWVRS